MSHAIVVTGLGVIASNGIGTPKFFQSLMAETSYNWGTRFGFESRVLASVFNQGQKEPSNSNSHTEVVQYADGTRLTYDTQEKGFRWMPQALY